MVIRLKDILPIANLEDYKIHFAKWNTINQPLDVFTKNRDEWKGWQEYKTDRDDFNRPFIFSLARFYHEPSIWIFGGIFKVLARHAALYEVELTDSASEFIGRLKLYSPYNSRTVRLNMEGQYDDFEVTEILREPYTGRAFPGYEDIELSFTEIETIVQNARTDWKIALESIKGIYLITDVLTGKRYVGSAYGEMGVWGRWCNYTATGHGGNVELRALVTNPDLSYCRANFRFALLEHRSFRTADEYIIEREKFWKKLLLSRGDQGLNRN
jgi:hypothetical protein